MSTHPRFKCGLFLGIIFAAVVSATPLLAGSPVFLNKIGDVSTCFAASDNFTVKGVVVLEVSNLTYSASGGQGVVLRMKGPDGEFTSYMGPAQFLKNMGHNFKAGDKLDIEGVLASIDGSMMMVAKSYTSGGAMFTLRDSRGAIASR